MTTTEEVLIKLLRATCYKYLAQDEDGDIFAYEKRPEKGKSVWIDMGGKNVNVTEFAEYLTSYKLAWTNTRATPINKGDLS